MRSPDQADAPEPRDQAKQPSLVSGVQPSSSATASRAQAASSSRDAGSGGLESPQGNHDGQAPKAGAMGGAGLESVMAANGMRREPSKLHVTARIPGGESLTVPTELQTVKELTLATLDRNEYQPGASLSFRTVTLSRSRLTPTPRQPIEVSVVTAERQPVLNLTMVVESIQGTANGQFQLPAELAEGRYWLVVKSPHASFPEWERAFVVSRSAQHNSSAKTTESLPDQPAAETQPNNNPQDRAQRESVQPDPAPQDSIPQGDTKRGAEQPAGEQLRRDAVTSDRTESTGTAATGTAPARGLVLPRADRGESASPTPAILPSPSAPPASRDVSSLLGPWRVTFYPEGGDLVAGVPNRVYFTVGDMDGRPVQASSELIDAEGRQVAEPAFLRPGLGSVSWTPQASKAYWLRFPGHPIAPQAFRVPACDPLATLTMRVTRSVVSADAPVELDLHSLQPAERLLVQVSCRGETVGLALVRAAAFRTLDPSQWAVPAASAATTHPPADSSDRAAFNLPVPRRPVFASPAIAPSVSLSGAFIAPGETLTSSSAAWKHVRVRLPLGTNAYGALRVTVSDFSSSFPRPLVERLVFRHSPHQLHIQLADPLGRHVAGTEMALRVQTRDEWSRPVATQLGLTIVGPVQQAETVAAKGLNDTNRPRRHRERLPGERREHGNQLASGNADPSANLEPETILARLPQHPSTVTDSERQAVTIDENREGPSGGSPSKDDAETVGVGGRVEANGLNPWGGMTPWERDSPDRFFLGYEERWEIGRAETGFAEGRIQAVNLLSCLSGREWESVRVLDQSARVLDAILATAGWRRFVADSDASPMNQATNRHASLPQRPVVLEPSLMLISTRSELLATQVAPPEQPTEEVQRVPNPQVENSNETRTQGRSTERGVRDWSAPVDTGAASNTIDAAPQPGGGSGPREPVTDLPRLVTHVAKSMHSLKQPGSADRGGGLAGPLPLHRWGPLLAVLSLVLLVFSRVARRRNGAPSQRWRTAARASLFITLVIGTFWSIRPWMTYIPPQTASQQVDGDLERAPTSPASSPLAQANPVPAASKPAASKPAASKPAASKPAVTKQIASAAVRSKPAAAAASGQAISSGDESSGVPLQANATGSDTIPSPRPGDHPAGVEGLLRDSFAKARKGVLEDIERAAVEDGSPLVESAVESPPESNSNQTVYYREFAVTEKWLVEHELDEQPARFSALTTLQSQANSPASAEPPPQLDQDTASTNEGENRSETQLWLPQLATTDRGETTIHWVLPQRPGQYLLRLDGHTQDGRIGSLLQRFEVIAPAGN